MAQARDDDGDDEPPRPAWDSGGAVVDAQLTRFRQMGFDAEIASELATTTARLLADQLEVARTRDDVVGVMRTAVQVASLAVRSVRDDRAQRRLPVMQAACRRGCAHCCRLHVSISAPEAIVIAAFLADTMPADELTALRSKVERFASRVRPMDQDARVRAMLPCPLLHEGACSIYPVRPLVCAGATSGDADACEQALGHPDASIPVEPIVHGAMRAVQLGVATAIAARGLDVGRYELAGALAAALSTDAASRWLAGEQVFEKSAGDLAVESIERTALAFVARDPHVKRRAAFR